MGGIVTEATLDDAALALADRERLRAGAEMLARLAPGGTGSDYELRAEDDGASPAVARFGEVDLPEEVRLLVAWIDEHPATTTRLVR